MKCVHNGTCEEVVVDDETSYIHGRKSEAMLVPMQDMSHNGTCEGVVMAMQDEISSFSHIMCEKEVI